jgi:WD40 repeat protein
LASGSHDQTARLWSVADGSAKATLAGHTGIVRSVAFSPDGRRLATGGSDHTVRLWDAETAKAVATFDGHTDTVCAVAFSPDGATLASGSQDRTVKLWDVGPGGASKRPGDAPLCATLEGHAGAVWCLAFSPQGKTLASGGLDKVCRLWNPQNRVLRAAPSFDSAVISVAFAPDARANQGRVACRQADCTRALNRICGQAEGEVLALHLAPLIRVVMRWNSIARDVAPITVHSAIGFSSGSRGCGSGSCRSRRRRTTGGGSGGSHATTGSA